MKRTCIERLALAAAAAAILGAVAGCSPSDTKKESASPGAAQRSGGSGIASFPVMRDVPLIAPNGAEYRLSNFRGKIVLLYVFATWHKECPGQFDELNELYNKIKQGNMTIIGLAIDKLGADAVKQFQMRQPIAFPVFVNGNEIMRDIGGLRKLPTTIVLLKDGRVYDRLAGCYTVRQIEDKLKLVVAQRL